MQRHAPEGQDQAGPSNTGDGPSAVGWWFGVVAFLIGTAVLVVPWPPGVHYAATEADGVNERSGWANCGTPILGAWTIAVTRGDEGSTLVAAPRPYPEGAEEDPLAAAQDACRTDAAARVALLAPGIVVASVVSYRRARRRNRDEPAVLTDRGDAARFAWAGFLGLVAVTRSVRRLPSTTPRC